MKKLYAIAIGICFTGSAFAQSSLYFKDDVGTDISNTTITVAGEPTDSDIHVYLEVGNSSGTNLDVKVTRYEMSCISGTENYFCWAQCYGNVNSCDPTYSQFPSPASPEWGDYVPISAGSSWPANGLFFGAYLVPLGFTGTATYRFTAFDSANPNDSVSVDITFDVAVGIEEEAAKGTISDAYPNPANGSTSISYELLSDDQATLEVYNMIGEKVEEMLLEGKEGTAIINTEDLESGVYFYSLSVDGTLVNSKKLIVTH